MKKIFSILAAIVFAGSMMAQTFNLEKVTSVSAGKSYVFVRNNHALIAVVDSKKLQTTDDFLTEGLEGNENYVWKLETNDEGFSIIANDGNYLNHKNKDTEMQLSASAWAIWTIKADSKGDLYLLNTKNGNNRFIGETGDGDNTYKAYAEQNLSGRGHDFTIYELTEAGPSDKPSIAAKKINFGTVKIAEEAATFELDTTLEVTAANLTEEIAVTAGKKVTVTEAKLPAAGGTLHLHITAAPGAFEDTIVLASAGVADVKVAIVGLVKQVVVLPGEPAEMKAGAVASKVTVNDVDGFKAGTSAYIGNVIITVPANTTKLHFFAAAWNEEPDKIGFEAEGVTFSPDSVALKDDPCFTGNSTSFTLRNLELSDCRFDIALTGVTAKTDISVSGYKRFVIWGATYETSATAVEHVEDGAKAVKMMENGQMVIIKNGVKYNALGVKME